MTEIYRSNKGGGKLNYIEQLNGFRIARTQTPLNTNAMLLYFILLEYNNNLGWIRSFSVANSVLEGLSGLSRKSLDNSRRELINKGYIEYKKGVGNQCGRYVIVQFGTQSAHSQHTVGTGEAHNHSTLTKQNKTKLNKKETTVEVEEQPSKPEPSIPYKKIQEEYNSICNGKYSKIVSINGKRKENVAARFKEYGFDLFTKAFKEMAESDFLQGKQDGTRKWKADFDWLILPSNFQKVVEGKYKNQVNMAKNKDYSQGEDFLTFVEGVKVDGN